LGLILGFGCNVIRERTRGKVSTIPVDNSADKLLTLPKTPLDLGHFVDLPKNWARHQAIDFA
jgi:hypothetical protein